jgi:hypothetical protein
VDAARPAAARNASRRRRHRDRGASASDADCSSGDEIAAWLWPWLWLWFGFPAAGDGGGGRGGGRGVGDEDGGGGGAPSRLSPAEAMGAGGNGEEPRRRVGVVNFRREGGGGSTGRHHREVWALFNTCTCVDPAPHVRVGPRGGVPGGSRHLCFLAAMAAWGREDTWRHRSGASRLHSTAVESAGRERGFHVVG